MASINKNGYIDCMNHAPVMVLGSGGAAAGADTTVSHIQLGRYVLEKYHNGALDDDDSIADARAIVANVGNGLQVSIDSDDDFGCEFGFGILADANRFGAFKIGTDPAFFFEAKIGLDDVSNYQVCAVGFRKAAAYVTIDDEPTDLGSAVQYTDFSYVNGNAGAIETVMAVNQTGGGTGTATAVDSTENWADLASKTLRVNVSATGVCSWLVDGAALTTVSAVTTFDTDDIVIPSLLFVKAEAGAVGDNAVIEHIKIGLQ